jgi:CheY-like chemotaxis protein
MKKTRILIIDDEVDFTELLQLNLEVTGRYEVATVNAATSAVSVAHAFCPDVILLDVLMPDLAGGDVLARLESQQALRRIPVIFITALAPVEEFPSRKKRKTGEPLTLPKPVNMDRLEQAIASVLEHACV